MNKKAVQYMIYLINCRMVIKLMSVSSSTVGGGRTKYKIIFLGDQSVGKSSIIEKYIKDKFQDGLNPTIGIDFHIKNVTRNGHQFRIQLWDTAGQERFRSLIPNYMKDANCAVMVYDVTKKSTLANLKIWNDMFEEHQMPDAIKVVVGNKIDLQQDRQVTKKEGEAEALKYNAQHLEVSAKHGKRLDELFNNIIDLIADHLENRGRLPAVEEESRAANSNNAVSEAKSSKFELKSKRPEESTQKPGGVRSKCC